MNNDTYILQKDIPGLKAGAEFVHPISYRGGGVKNYYCHFSREGKGCDEWSDEITFSKIYVENNPEWFLLKDQTKGSEFIRLLHGFAYYGEPPIRINGEGYMSIKDVIRILNNHFQRKV